jgi:hypothetical protein
MSHAEMNNRSIFTQMSFNLPRLDTRDVNLLGKSGGPRSLRFRALQLTFANSD